ncbi:MAG: TIGR02594 family protein [Pseudolabrys sp.]|nr:TIGR02594 family protein [Pseudolabrys sp.]
MILLKRQATLLTLLLCAVALAVSAGSASARPAHKAKHRSLPPAQLLNNSTSPDGQPYPLESVEKAVAKKVKARATKAKGHTKSGHAKAAPVFGGFTSNSLVAEARKYIGTNPTGRRSLWCGAFMDLVLKRTGHPGGGNLASAYASYGTRVSGPRIGAIAVMPRRGGGHVGVVSGIDPNGNPIIISGNHNRTTAESVYPRSRITAYVVPGG